MNRAENKLVKDLSDLMIVYNGQWAIEDQSFMCSDDEENAMYVFIKENQIIFHTYYSVHKDYCHPYPATYAGMVYGIGLN